jgi:hypothetical protein
MAAKKKAKKKASKKSATKRRPKPKRASKPKIRMLIVGGRELKADKGYEFKVEGNGIALMKAGTKTTTFTCECSSGTGGCRVEMNGQTAECLEGGCSGTCGWVVNVPGIFGLPAMRLAFQ